MLTKKQFVSYLNAIIDYKKRMEIINEAFNSIKWDISIFGDMKIEDEIINLLNDSMGVSEFNDISWWIYERGSDIITVGKKKYNVSTPELLYKFLSETRK